MNSPRAVVTNLTGMDLLHLMTSLRAARFQELITPVLLYFQFHPRVGYRWRRVCFGAVAEVGLLEYMGRWLIHCYTGALLALDLASNRKFYFHVQAHSKVARHVHVVGDKRQWAQLAASHVECPVQQDYFQHAEHIIC